MYVCIYAHVGNRMFKSKNENTRGKCRMYKKAPLSHPLDQAITTNVYLSLLHHAINLV